MLYRILSRARLSLGLIGLTLLATAPAMAQSSPRPYLQQLGSEEAVRGVAVARNGYTLFLLAGDKLVVAGPDQILRPPQTHPEISSAVSIATSPSGEPDDTLVYFYVVSRTHVKKLSYNTETRALSNGALSSYAFPTGTHDYYPTAITVAPDGSTGGTITPGSVYVGGQRKTVGSTAAAQTNFLIKLNPSLVQQGSTKSWGVPTSFGANTSNGANQLHALTADADGNVFVSAQWPAVYSTEFVTFFNFFSRLSSWSIKNESVGLDSDPLTNVNIQASIKGYTQTRYFLGFIPIGDYTFSLPSDAENRTGYFLRFNSSLQATHYSNTTNQVPLRQLWAAGVFASNVSSFPDIRLGSDNFLYAVGNWQGLSSYTAEQTVGMDNNIQVIKLDPSNLTMVKAARVKATGASHPGYSIDVAPGNKIFVTGVTEEGTNTFTDTDVGTSDISLAGRGIFIAQLNSDLGWVKVNKSNSPAPAALSRAFLRWNPESNHAQVAGTFTAGQLSLGSPARPALLPTGPVAGNVNYYALAGATGDLINQINVIVRSEFVTGNQILTRLGDNPAIPLTNFDMETREGAVGLLSDAAGATVTISVPPNIYFDKDGAQVFPQFQSGNEIAPENAVSRHRCTGFSVSGDATTGATNTYTFAVSADTKVIFNWFSEHALEVFSKAADDLGLPGSTADLGSPTPTVNKHWYPANQPVTAFIDNAALEPAVYGKRYRVTGFDTTGSVLKRGGTGALPPLPPGRVLRTLTASIAADKRTVTPATPAPVEEGWLVEGDGVSPDTTIISVTRAGDNATSFQLSKDADPGTDVKLSFTNSKIQTTVNTTLALGSAGVTLATPTGLRAGWQVSGPGIAEGTTVQSVASATQLTLSKPTIPLRRNGRMTAPAPTPEIVAPTLLTPNSSTASIDGSVAVTDGMQIRTEANKIAEDTLVQSVTEVPTSITTGLTNNTTKAVIAYRDNMREAVPVKGAGIPANTIILGVAAKPTPINSQLTNGFMDVIIPPSQNPLPGIPVIDPDGGLPAGAKIFSVTPNTETISVEISGGNVNGRVSNAVAAKIKTNAIVDPIPAYFTNGTKVTGKVTVPVPKNATYANGSNTITVNTNTDLRVGDVIIGNSHIPAGTTVAGISGTTITLSGGAVTTSAGTNVPTTFQYTNLKFDPVVNSGVANDSVVNLTFINDRTVELTEAATVTANRNLEFVTELELTLSNPATTTSNAALNYIFQQTLALSKPALSGAVSGTPETLTYFFPPDSGATTVRVTSVDGLQTGMQVTGPGIPDGTVISSVQAPNTIIISQVPTQSGSFMLEFFNPSPQLTFFSNYGSYAFYDREARQQVPQWIMSGPATITYRWITQFHVQVSTTVQTAQDFPEVRLDPAVPVPAGEPGYGTGEHWFDIGSNVYIGGRLAGGTSSRQLSGWLNATVPPFPTDRGSFDFANTPDVAIPSGGNRQSPGAFYYVQVPNMLYPVRILWNYGGTIYRVNTVIGNAVNFDTSIPALNGPSGTVRTPLHTVKNFPPDRAQVVEGPSGSAPDQMSIWDNLAKRLLPLRPGITLFEYGSQENPLIVEVSSSYPSTPILHITHPDLPGVNLDPSATDRIAWQQLAFSSGNGSADGGSFVSTQSGYSVIVFSERDISDPSPGNGNLSKETLTVKVVETRQWDDILGAAPPQAAEIGKRLTRNLGPPTNDVLDTGFVVYPRARYNADIYDRTTILGSGPIIPVNRQFTGVPEDELVVIWYGKPDAGTGITWTHSVQRFDPQWPVNPPRIVIASRLGSEGKNADGQDQLVFTRDKYSDVIVYNQADREAPGYNPNEEHALIAPSLKFQDQANPPPVAYALQSGLLNVPHDSSLTVDLDYTSDPYVLVQYFDIQAKQSKMAVYAIESEDSSADLNPYIDPRNNRRYNYTFDYQMTVGEPVQPPYPLGRVIGLVACPETFGINTTAVKAYWEDYNGVPYAAGQGAFNGHFYYRLQDAFWGGEGDDALAVGDSIPFGTATEGGKILVTGTVVQGATANAYDGSVNSPVFHSIFEGTVENPTFLPTYGPNDISYNYSGTTSYNDIPRLEFQAQIDTESAVTIRFTGNTAQDLVDAVNAKPEFVGKLKAEKTAEGKIRFELLQGQTLLLTDLVGQALQTAGLGAGQLVPKPSLFTVKIGVRKVNVSVNGRTPGAFVLGLLKAFPGGEVSATLNGSLIRVLVNGPYALELTDGLGSPLKLAGFGVGDDQPFSPTQTTTVPAGFQAGSKFVVNFGDADITVTIAGTTDQDFVNAVNTNASLSGKLSASLTLQNRIRLTLGNVTELNLNHPTPLPAGKLALDAAGLPVGRTILAAQPVLYFAKWPENPPILKAGETLTYAGGEYRADNPAYPGLPGVIGWGVGEIIFDSMNPTRRSVVAGGLPSAFGDYTARLISPLEPRRVSIGTEEQALQIAEIIQPASGLTRAYGTVWKFTGLPASLSRRLFYDPLTRELGINGYVNDKTLGDSTLTAAPPPLYVLEPNIITQAELDEMLAIPELASNPAWFAAVNELYRFCRNPNEVSKGVPEAAPYYVGLTTAYEEDPSTGEVVLDADGEPELRDNSAMNAKIYGPGLALVPSAAFLDPNRTLPESYVTLVENNDEDIGGPVTLRVIKVVKNRRFRGAIKTITSDNVFSEQLTMRHSGDFGANADDIVYQWYYREEDGSESPVPPGPLWNLLPDTSNSEPRGLGQFQIELKGNPILLLADQLFFLRYRHKDEEPAGGPNSTNWADTKWEEYGSEWAGAANSRPGAYQPQLAMGWVKRVLDRINPYEARFNDFRNNDAPSTYVSMILQAGQRFEGPVALNPDKNVVENLGLIELYETVLNRGRGLSIDLSTPVVTGGINNALLLAATRVADLYMLLGNEAYSDAVDPTIGFGSNTADYGHAAANMFSFQNQLPSLLDEELALLRGRSLSYGRPVYNRLFWNFTKSEGEVAYAMNYNLTDINKDGFIDEKDALIFYPQGHGDAWGHYLTAIKSQYNLLKHPYFNWVSRSEFYNLMDVVVEVDYYDERKFADAAAARAKTGSEIVDLTYRSRYVEDPDGQWQGYSDTDADRAWGVDGWAKRAGQGAYLDWVTANAIIPAEDPREGLRKVDRTTVTAIHTIATQLGKIQATEDNSSSGLNPLGLSPDAVPMDFEPALAGPGGTSQFEQISNRAEQAIQNAFHIFDNANEHGNRLRMQGVSAQDFSKQTYEQDRDYRNRLIEIFGTPYSGQIGPGRLYPTGYSGPDLALYMYVDVNDLNDETVPAPNGLFQDIWKSFPQMMSVDAKKFTLGATKPVDIGVNDGAFRTVFSQYFLADVIQPKADQFGNKLSDVFTPANIATALDSITGVASYFNAMSLEMNLPISAAGYTFRAPADWGMRSSPGELQAVISELVQAQAALGLAVGNYDYLLLDIQTAAQALRAQHGISTANVKVKDHVRKVTLGLNSVLLTMNTVGAVLESRVDSSKEIASALVEAFPRSVGVSPDVTSGARAFVKTFSNTLNDVLTYIKLGIDAAAGAIEIGRDDLGVQAELEIEKFGYELEIQQKLKEIEMMLWNEASSRVEVFEKLEAMRQVSDRYRTVLGNGLALIDERADHNRQAAGAVQLMRYQDMAFRVFRNDSLQKYRAAFDLAQRYTYLAAKAYDYETNLAPDDPGSSQPILQEIVRNRVLGDWYFGVTPARGGVSEQLVRLRSNYEVLKGRLGLNNPQVNASSFSLRREQAKTDSAGWKQLLRNSRTADLWEVPEFRRYCRPPRARSAGKLPGLVIPFSTETVFGRNFFGKALAGGDTAFNPTNFANKIASAGVSFEGYPVAALAATPQVYLVPAGLDVMTIPNSLNLETRQWNVVDQALPVPFPVNSSNLANTDWVPVIDGLNGPLAAIRRFSSFRAGVTAGEPPLSSDTRLAGRSVWNTRWLLIIPGGSMLANGDNALEQFINRVTDINLYLDTYGYSGN